MPDLFSRNEETPNCEIATNYWCRPERFPDWWVKAVWAQIKSRIHYVFDKILKSAVRKSLTTPTRSLLLARHV